jgi:hypothetical protein
MEADKLRGYTVKEWRQMIEDKVWAIYQTKFLFCQAKYIRKKKCSKQRGP